MKQIMRQMVKRYLKSLGSNRDVRIILIGKRLAAKQHAWLHFMPQTCDKE